MNLHNLNFLQLNKLALDINIELLTRYWYIWLLLLSIGIYFIIKKN